MTFLRWARVEGYAVDPRLLELKRPKVPSKEPTVYHIAQLREILAACNLQLRQEALAVLMDGLQRHGRLRSPSPCVPAYVRDVATQLLELRAAMGHGGPRREWADLIAENTKRQPNDRLFGPGKDPYAFRLP